MKALFSIPLIDSKEYTDLYRERERQKEREREISILCNFFTTSILIIITLHTLMLNVNLTFYEMFDTLVSIAYIHV